MHDDISLTIGRVRRVLTERILPAIYSETLPLDLSWHELPGEPVTPAEGLALDYQPTSVGTPWSTLR